MNIRLDAPESIIILNLFNGLGYFYKKKKIISPTHYSIVSLKFCDPLLEYTKNSAKGPKSQLLEIDHTIL